MHSIYLTYLTWLLSNAVPWRIYQSLTLVNLWLTRSFGSELKPNITVSIILATVNLGKYQIFKCKA